MADTKYVGLTTSEIIRMGVLLAAMAAMAAGYAGLRTETTRLVEDIAGHTVLECHPSACVALGRTDERLIQLDKRMIEQASTAAAARSNLSAAASGANTDITSLTANAMTPSGGTLNVTGNVTAYSAAAAKDDIVQIPNALELVQRMRGVSFRWKHEDRGYEKSREALTRCSQSTVNTGSGGATQTRPRTSTGGIRTASSAKYSACQTMLGGTDG